MRSGWTEVALGEVMTLASDPVAVSAAQSYPNLGLLGFARGTFSKSPINGGSSSATTLYRVRAGQFIYSRLFAFEGAYGIVRDEQDGFFVSNEFPAFDVDPSRVLAPFLFAYFKLPAVWSALAGQAVGMGDRRRRVHPETVLAHRLPLPPLAEQQRIVARLDAIETRLNRVQQLREEQTKELQAALRSAFHRLESGAEWKKFGEVAPITRRHVAIIPEQRYEELGARSFGRGIFHKPSFRGDELTWEKLFRVEEGDLVISNIKAWEGAIAVAGRQDHGRVGSHRYITAVADPARLLPEFLCFYLLSPDGLGEVGKASPGSADRNRTLSVSRLEEIEVPVPPLPAQREFQKLLALQTRVSACAAESEAAAAALLPSLLDQVFNP